jgi:hypothetical protein
MDPQCSGDMVYTIGIWGEPGCRRREQQAGPAWRAPLMFTGLRTQGARRKGDPPRRSGYGDGTKVSSLWVFFFWMFMPIGTAC